MYPHTHPTREFYFMMSGKGMMRIGDERREVLPGDLIYIIPGAEHSLRTIGEEPVHCFCFAVGVKGAGPINCTTTLSSEAALPATLGILTRTFAPGGLAPA